MARRSDRQRATTTARSPAGQERTGSRVHLVHRAGAVVIGVVLLVFAVLGFARGLAFFSTSGQTVLGLSTNGLLSTISVVVGLVLIGAATLGGPRTASTVMIVVGILFLLSALANLFVLLLDEDLNILAFEFNNVVFSVVVGLVLLLLGAYGRISGNLPDESPYHRPTDTGGAGSRPLSEDLPHNEAEAAADEALREAERAVAQGTATGEQRRRVEAMSHVSRPQDRRRVWMESGGPPR
ncbi:DUF4383 domain-containing protein [Geodermatophilus marinus]|uniref:DUF4383 domain-containing protein n=1 Tax=Geodermatophilus sp. LHW52908 TaxID=2303986 RepID=UPI000E3E3813|nr:DUF4383 domain-containing protein [Geodermatophilus sp. LHW52908]RFU22240.1 DUF4383 domain-containing protein [Geodermatophilus sp. LHW52908]